MNPKALLVLLVLSLPNLVLSQSFTPVASPGITDISGTGAFVGTGDDAVFDQILGGAGFPFFGTTYGTLRVSTNGFLSTNLAANSDTGNSAALPSGDPGDIFVLHDDLDGGNIYHQYFAAGPYANPSGSTTGANVFQWDNTNHFFGGGPFDVQAALFDDGNMLFLYGPGNPETGSGSTTGVQSPDRTFGLLYAANTGGSIPDNFALYYIAPGIVAIAPAAAVSRPRTTPTYLLVNQGAILSTNTSGLGMGLVNQQVVQGAPNAALRDLNNRLFRSRSGVNAAPMAMASTFGGDSSLLRYLAFVQDENMSYKVALGLADPEERTVKVNVADTLSAQIGTNFNGQSLSGGLPYAMMGVPMMPMAGGAATVQIVEAAPSGKTVIDDSKAVIEMAPRNQWEVFVAGDFSFYDQDQLTDMMEGFDTDTYAGSVGIEYRIKEWLNLGLAWSYLQSDTDVSGNYGNIDLEGNLISGYATAFWRQYWADILYSYGSFNNDINRNTGLGGRARGDADSQSHNIRLNFGRNFNVGNNVVTGPIAGLQYANGDIDPYSESGGGAAALDYSGTSFESMVSRLGWQATHYRSTNWGRLVSQVNLAWEHEYMPENGTVGASLQTSPFALVTGSNVNRFGSYSAEHDGAHPGTDWLSAGAGLRFELANGVAFLTDYEGVFFRSNSSQHYASAKLSYEWGAIMPSGKTEDVSGTEIVAYEPLPTEQSDRQITAVTETTQEVAEKKQSPATFVEWLNKGDRNGESVASAGSKSEAMKKSADAAYEPLTVQQPESHAATPSEVEADLPQVTKKKKSTGGVIGWLQNRKSKSGEPSEQTAEVKVESDVEEVAEPVAVSSTGRSRQKDAVVYRTWNEVPGLKKTDAAVAPAKAAVNDPSS